MREGQTEESFATQLSTRPNRSIKYEGVKNLTKLLNLKFMGKSPQNIS